MDWETKTRNRDRKLSKRRSAKMVVSNRSLKTTILPLIRKREQAARKRLQDEERCFDEDRDPKTGDTSY
jgi:hypothetical protein